jgi:predicted metalloprotease with PDZ domain
MSGELWLAEGFTNYYGSLILQRAGLASLADTVAAWGRTIDALIRSSARKYRSAEDVSRMAPFVDSAAPADGATLDNTYISYYEWGEAIALGLDLTLRERSGGAISLDDYMRVMWSRYGKPGGPSEGLVGHAYTAQDARDALAEASGDRSFANEFFDRYIHGRDVVDYRTLLGKAGLLLKRRTPATPWIGPLQLSFDGGAARVVSPTIEDTPAYLAGLDEDDEIALFDGELLSSSARMDQILGRHKPGDLLQLRIRRGGTPLDLTIATQADPRLELVPTDSSRPLTQPERALRDAWLKSKQ